MTRREVRKEELRIEREALRYVAERQAHERDLERGREIRRLLKLINEEEPE